MVKLMFCELSGGTVLNALVTQMQKSTASVAVAFTPSHISVCNRIGKLLDHQYIGTLILILNCTSLFPV